MSTPCIAKEADFWFECSNVTSCWQAQNWSAEEAAHDELCMSAHVTRVRTLSVLRNLPGRDWEGGAGMDDFVCSQGRNLHESWLW